MNVPEITSVQRSGIPRLIGTVHYFNGQLDGKILTAEQSAKVANEARELEQILREVGWVAGAKVMLGKVDHEIIQLEWVLTRTGEGPARQNPDEDLFKALIFPWEADILQPTADF